MNRRAPGTPPDIEQVHLGVAAFLGFLENIGGEVEGLDVVFKVGGLTADMETQAFYCEAGFGRREDQIHRFAGGGAKF